MIPILRNGISFKKYPMIKFSKYVILKVIFLKTLRKTISGEKTLIKTNMLRNEIYGCLDFKE